MTWQTLSAEATNADALQHRINRALAVLEDARDELQDSAEYCSDGGANDDMRRLVEVEQAIAWLRYGRPYA